MHDERSPRALTRADWARALGLVCVAAAGLVAIVGSGGGALGFPPCEGLSCGGGPPPPPPPSVAVDPPYVTAQVGTAVRFSAVLSNIGGTPLYQWQRSNDGGASYTQIAGATAPTLLLEAVNLADDGSRFRVDVRAANGATIAQAVAQLLVSATPSVVYADGEFALADWSVAPVVDAGQAAVVHVEAQAATGGDPGAFRQMTDTVPQSAGAVRVFHLARQARYDPALQGAVRVIDYGESCIALQPSVTTSTESSLVIEQAGRRYLSNTSAPCLLTTWSPVGSRASLGAQDFRLFDGPPCAAGESCPDFSATAAPMNFGYWRISFGMPGDVIGHGIDNWRVTVWRQ